jgi:hypothetical protein
MLISADDNGYQLETGTDWCFAQNSGRTRQAHPYSYDAHFVWRDFDKADMSGIVSVYSDRMRDWDPRKYDAAMSAATKATGRCWVEDLTKESTSRFIEVYYDGVMDCVGFGRACNVSTGYGIGLFFIKDKSPG